MSRKSSHHDGVLISVVTPAFDEESNVVPLADELEAALRSLGRSHEILFVDDGSTDGSRRVLAKLARERPACRVLYHRTNCGQSAALATGFRAALGEIIVTMDSDRQNDPADLPRLLDALVPGVDCVTGVRQKRNDDWIRRVSSRIANAVRNLLLGERVADAGCTYRAIRRPCLAEIPVFNGMHRFLPTVLRLQGFTVVEVSISHRPRVAGVAKYGIHDRLWRGLRDCLAMRWYRRRVIPGNRTTTEPVVTGEATDAR